MHFRNGKYGYGVVTKLLHWTTVVAVTLQFVVGWTMSDDGTFDAEKDRIDRLEDLGEDAAERRGEEAERRFDESIDQMRDDVDAREDNVVDDAFDAVFSGRFVDGGLSRPEIHILLGLTILLLAVLRVGWRLATPLPPWADYLPPGVRRLESGVEKALLTLLFVVPVTGLSLIALDSDWLALHIAAQVMLLVAVATHVAVVVTYTLVRPHRHLARMV